MDNFPFVYFTFIVLALIFVLASYAIKLHHTRVSKDMYDKRSIDQFHANTARAHMEYMCALQREKANLSPKSPKE